ncbi:GIN domain-containing protein [Mucilaginibacter sp. AW1-3]
MKTITLTIATVLLFILTISTPGHAATKNNNIETVLSNVSNFTNIEVAGNVELYVSTGEANNVKVYDSYYNQNALVQEQNGVLRISSYKTEKLVVWVTVADLHAITASDNAVVKSFGKLTAIDLNLNLKDKASAQLDLDVSNAAVVLNGDAKAKLSGFAGESIMTVDPSAHLNVAKLTAGKNEIKAPVVMASVAQTDEIAIVD